jgi:hemoglobin
VKDITNRQDIEILIRHFYDNLLTHEEIRPAFAGLDFEKHIPQIVHFWSFVLLDEEGYRTNVFDKHRNLPIKPQNFDLWLQVFTDTVNSLYKGEKADLAILRATVLAHTFKSKWQTR